MLFPLCVQEDIAAFKDYTAEDAKGGAGGGGGGTPKKQAAPESEGKKAEAKQEKAPQKPQQKEQKPAPPQPQQPSGIAPGLYANLQEGLFTHSAGEGVPPFLSGGCIPSACC